MASPESFEVWATLRTKIQAEKGPPHPKIEKNKCVLKWFLGKIQCFKPMLLIFRCISISRPGFVSPSLSHSLRISLLADLKFAKPYQNFTKWYSMVPNGSRWYPIVPDGTWWYWLYPMADVEIMVQPSSLAARNYLGLQKLFGKSPEVCQIYFENVASHPIFQ